MSLSSWIKKITVATEKLNAKSIEKVSISISHSFTSRHVDVQQKTKGVLPSISIDSFGGYISPSGGFVNYARFQITGINPATKRKNKRVYEVCTKEIACKNAENEGLVGPYEVVVLPSISPSDNQLSYAKALKAVIPNGACSFDVSAIISRINDNDENPVSEKLARQAHNCGLKFSRYHGKITIMSIAKGNLSKVEYKNFISSL